MDLDCIACIALARVLYPDHQPVKNGSIHPRARNLYNLYEKELDFLPIAEVDGADVQSIVMVDTQSYARVAEVLDRLGSGRRDAEMLIYDHHPADQNDFPHATVVHRPYGAGATILVEALQEQIGSAGDIRDRLSPDVATVALCGIYADTGNFTHANVHAADLRAAGILAACGGSLQVATSLSKPIADERQWELFHQALHDLRYIHANGHRIALVSMHLPKNTPGLAAVAEHVFESEQPDALFASFAFDTSNSTLIVARSARDEIQVSDLMAEFGGGGHPKASSALVKDVPPDQVAARLDEAIRRRLGPALRARQIMTSEVQSVAESASLLDASRFLESINHTGVPVVNADGILVGFLTLRDIMKGRRQEMMHAPVKAFMSRKVVTCGPDHTMRDLASLFFQHNIGHLPVVQDGELIGIVTRSDYLRTLQR